MSVSQKEVKSLKDCFENINCSPESLTTLTSDEFGKLKPTLMEVVAGRNFHANRVARNYQIKDLYQESNNGKVVVRMYVEQTTNGYSKDFKPKIVHEHFWMTLPLHLRDPAVDKDFLV
jgi:hypothetical protein